MPTKNRKKATKPVTLEIYVVVEGGVVHEVHNLPANIELVIIDLDTEGVEDERLQKSPLDSRLCTINRFTA